ncbi:hypothetical protein A3I25_01315 [Candidatus Nomurabacteria bacterium RIFCSPLOWO2_02_FULL_42_17]|uniref:Bacterial type II secretion system protein E domain-containing protein n=2 Tax=Candidatus Nomuraibacteriota TaxID=1752729 RepID=A0A1F6WH67_9BACT|nr:MAG: type II secretion system protein E [Parcubacteria group bacterium GW2011_GWA2_42_18]OGI81258.1 MAG: hypothetical protein A3B93_00360 [Candidatus Nomurabacteria bacterium RIFCSPHIGHO2_02_FULL_42_24]OGI97345.1 MAG: hypothetical protein A3I25_01315 [Candidatus Nomurabacteria bacterium RIFCSPLOWO2_02_FULL_42_17]
MNFLEELVKQGLISRDKIAEIRRRARDQFSGNIDSALLEIGVSEKALIEAKSRFYNIPFKEVDRKSVSFDLLKNIPEESVSHYQFAPIGFTDGVLEVGLTDPENIKAMDALQFISTKLNLPFKIFLISQSDFDFILSNYKGMSTQVGQAVSDIEANLSSAGDALPVTPKTGESIIEDAPIIKIVDVAIRHALEGRASDIHIEPTDDKVKVRFRVDGLLSTTLLLPPNVLDGIVARIKILTRLRLDEKRKPQDGSFSQKVDGRKIDFRVSTFPTYYGEKVVIRILDPEQGVKTLDALGFSPEHIKLIKEGAHRPYGLILLTGPTGSGKTTTLYAMLNELDREKYNVVSLEDPVEYRIKGVNQSQVMPEIGYNFASGLRSILRQDPDIIMVGEIRDKETAQLAIQAALTGHLVFSTLHTNNAIGVVPRLVDMGIDPYLIAPTLNLVIAQRLVRMACPSARQKKPMNPSIRAWLEKQFNDLPAGIKTSIKIPAEMYEITSSPDCPSGTRGRIGAFEIFSVDQKIQNVILANPVELEIYKVARAQGMLTMQEDAAIKALRGDIPWSEVYDLGVADML